MFAQSFLNITGPPELETPRVELRLKLNYIKDSNFLSHIWGLRGLCIKTIIAPPLRTAPGDLTSNSSGLSGSDCSNELVAPRWLTAFDMPNAQAPCHFEKPLLADPYFLSQI